MTRWSRNPWRLVGLLVALHLGFALFVNEPGYLTYDSGTYHFMVKTFAETGGFTVENGYEELPSPELIVAQLRAPLGKLVAQYPETYTLLALPFYLMMGYPGLIFLNALAFVAVVLLLHRLAMRLFGDQAMAFAAMAIYAFATFAWEWSHSSYPHLSSTLFLLLAVYWISGLLFGDAARETPADAAAFWPALGAGFVVGVAVGLRLDAIFVLPGLGLPLLLARPVRWRALLALGAGLTPGLLFLSLTNQAKFGTYNPFSYGAIGGSAYHADLMHYAPATGAGLAIAALLLAWRWWAARRFGATSQAEGTDDEMAFLTRHLKILVAAGLLAAGVAAVLAPEIVRKVASGTFQVTVDMRIRPKIEEAGLLRSENGAMVYMGGVKKSLLESCPWLALLYVPLLAALRGAPGRLRLLFLLFLPLPFLGVFGSLAWHGSVALNMRYLNPVLPWLAILGAWLWVHLPERPRLDKAWAVALMAFLVFYVAFKPVGRLRMQELLFLDLPLAMAAALVACELLGRFRPGSSTARRALAPLVLISFALSAALVLARDYPTSARQRHGFLDVTRQLQPHIESPAILFCDTADVMWGLLDKVDDLIVARPSNDNFGSMSTLIAHFAPQGRKAYVVTSRRLPPIFVGHAIRELTPISEGGRPPEAMLLEVAPLDLLKAQGQPVVTR